MAEQTAKPDKHSYGQILKSSALDRFSDASESCEWNNPYQGDGGVAGSVRVRVDGSVRLDCRSYAERRRYTAGAIIGIPIVYFLREDGVVPSLYVVLRLR
jgi:hypothetical protein